MQAVAAGIPGRSEFAPNAPGGFDLKGLVARLSRSGWAARRARPQRARELVCPSTMLARRAPPAKQETMMNKSTDKSPKTRTELEALVLAELRAVPQCGGALHVTVVAYDDYRVPATWEVTVVAYDDYRVPATWEVASFNPGTSEQEKCELALCEIVSRLQQCFDISQ